MAQPSIDRNDILRAYPAATRSAPLLEAVVLDAAPGARSLLEDVESRGDGWATGRDTKDAADVSGAGVEPSGG